MFMRALDRLRSVLRAPALKAAVAARECGECEDGDGGDAAAPLLADESIRDEEGDLEGGKELRSGIFLQRDLTARMVVMLAQRDGAAVPNQRSNQLKLTRQQLEHASGVDPYLQMAFDTSTLCSRFAHTWLIFSMCT